MSKPEQDQIDAEFEKARWVSLQLPAMVTAEEVRFGRKVWRLGYLAGAAGERDIIAAICEAVRMDDSMLEREPSVTPDFWQGMSAACYEIIERIRQRGEAGERPEEK